MNRRNFFSFIAVAPVAAVTAAKTAMDANGNDAAPLVGDFYFRSDYEYFLAEQRYALSGKAWQRVPDEGSSQTFWSES